jgi:signal transduction histidine kinase
MGKTDDKPADSTRGNQPELERQLILLMQKLDEAQRLTALGELVSTTTHEFNNVLMTVINYAKLGLRHPDAESRDKAFQRILAAGERAAKITHTILGMARNRSDQLVATDLSQLVQDVLVLLEREMNKYRIRVDFQAEPVPPVLASGNQIQQVLVNLLINARQAMPEGGEIVIRITYDETEDWVCLLVRDSGVGIPAHQLPRIFEPFFSTKSGPDASGKGGTGLGLSACHQIIRAHGGRIRVESTPGKGTAFTIRLPAAKDAAASRASSSAARQLTA